MWGMIPRYLDWESGHVKRCMGIIWCRQRIVAETPKLEAMLEIGDMQVINRRGPRTEPCGTPLLQWWRQLAQQASGVPTKCRLLLCSCHLPGDNDRCNGLAFTPHATWRNWLQNSNCKDTNKDYSSRTRTRTRRTNNIHGRVVQKFKKIVQS